jgi:hypothetical protein
MWLLKFQGENPTVALMRRQESSPRVLASNLFGELHHHFYHIIDRSQEVIYLFARAMSSSAAFSPFWSDGGIIPVRFAYLLPNPLVVLYSVKASGGVRLKSP